MKIYKKVSLILLLLVVTINYGFSQITGKVTTEANKSKYRANTVVYIEKANGSFKPQSKNAVMNQKNQVFIPHVLPVIAGTTIDFLNSDDVLHNVFSPDQCCKFDLGSYPKGKFKSQKFTKAGCQSIIL